MFTIIVISLTTSKCAYFNKLWSITFNGANKFKYVWIHVKAQGINYNNIYYTNLKKHTNVSLFLEWQKTLSYGKSHTL